MKKNNTCTNLIGIDEEIEIEMSTKILENYRFMNWPQKNSNSSSETMEQAVLYMKNRFYNTINKKVEISISEINEVVLCALKCVGEYPKDGKIYFDILHKCYLEGLSENECLELFYFSRSTFYKKKREAKILFMFSLIDKLSDIK